MTARYRVAVPTMKAPAASCPRQAIALSAAIVLSTAFTASKRGNACGAKGAGHRLGPLNRRRRDQPPRSPAAMSSNRDIRRHRARGRTPHRRARYDHVASGLAGMAGDGVVGLNCRSLGRIQIGAARNRGSGTAKVFLSADGSGVDCAGPRPSLGRSGAGSLGKLIDGRVAQPESNFGSVGMVGSRPWNFGA